MHFSLDLDDHLGLRQLVAQAFVLRLQLHALRQGRTAAPAVGAAHRCFEEALAVLATPVGDQARVVTWTPLSLSVQVASVCRSVILRQVSATSAGVR